MAPTQRLGTLAYFREMRAGSGATSGRQYGITAGGHFCLLGSDLWQYTEGTSGTRVCCSVKEGGDVLDKKVVLEGRLRYIGDDCEWDGLLLDDQDLAALLPRGEVEVVYTTGPFAGDLAWETISEQKYAELTAEIERLGYANTPELEELCALRASFVYRLYADWGRVRITIEPLDKEQ